MSLCIHHLGVGERVSVWIPNPETLPSSPANSPSPG